MIIICHLFLHQIKIMLYLPIHKPHMQSATLFTFMVMNTLQISIFNKTKFSIMTEENFKPKRSKSNDSSIITGVIMITLGILFLVDRYFPGIDFGDLWPFILIVVGVLITVRGFNNK